MTLAEQFAHWWYRIGAQYNPAGPYCLVANRYSESHRKYHKLGHIGHCLHEFKAVQNLCSHPEEVEGALWLHDVVYDTTPNSGNELHSAEFSNELLRDAGIGDVIRIRIMDHILATDHKTPPKSFDSQLVVDIDLAILGQPWERYQRYARQIREEWKHFSEGIYRKGRSQVLQTFLDRAHVYHTRDFRLKYEKVAQTNLAREIKALTS